MPTYQYACTAPVCGSRFDLVQSFTDPNASECPTCGGAVRKVFSAVGVVFKGAGFYRTDSRAEAEVHVEAGGRIQRLLDRFLGFVEVVEVVLVLGFLLG